MQFFLHLRHKKTKEYGVFDSQIHLISLFVYTGYKLIGSHSGVKLCRWTKVMKLFHFAKWITLMWRTHKILSCFFVVYVAREGWLLQAHFLWHWVPPVYGDDPQPCLCKQVRLLLEVMNPRQQRSRQNFTQNRPSKTSVKEVGPWYLT